MAEQVRQNVKVNGAQYEEESRCIVLAVTGDNKKFMTQIPLKSLLPSVKWDDFTEEERKKCAMSFCTNIIGKNILVVYDPDLDNKIKNGNY